MSPRARNIRLMLGFAVIATSLSTLSSVTGADAVSVLFVAESSPANRDDLVLIDRIEAAGASVVVVDDDSDLVAAVDGDIDLVWISSTVKPGAIGASLNDLPIPLGTHEANLFDDLGMATSVGEIDGDYRIRTIDGTVVPVMSAAGRISWGTVGGDVEVVATQRRSSGKATIFRYAADAELANGSTAANCRSGFFSTARTPTLLTTAGLELFDAEFAALVACIDQNVEPNVAPTIDALDDRTDDEFAEVQLTISASDADGDDLTFAESGLPAGLHLNEDTGVVSGRLDGVTSSTTRLVQFTVSDGEFEAVAQFDWTVTETGTEPPPREGPVNVVVIMTDDQTVEQMRWLPNVEAFMSTGTEFKNSLTNYPLCGPSRVTFMTGQYASNHGLDCNNGIAAKFHKVEDESLAPWLQASGVHTVHVGKYLNGYGGKSTTRYTPAGWSDWRALAGSSAYNYTAFDMVINGEFERFGRNGSNAYSTDVLSDQLDDALRLAPADDPFFAVFTPLAPHFQGGKTYAVPAERHTDTIDDVLRQPNYDSCYARPSCPTSGSDLRKNRLSSSEKVRIDNAYQTASESLSAVDEAFDRIVTTLDDIGRLDDTVIIFTSDNGFSYGEHGIDRGKKVPTRESLFVPLFIGGPGFDERVVEAPVVNADLTPTILDLFDVSVDAEFDGQSLMMPVPDDRAIYIEAKRQAGTKGYTGVFADGWLFVDWIGVTRHDLYGPNDTWQLETLDKVSEWNDVESELVQLTNELGTCAGSSCAVSWAAPSRL